MATVQHLSALLMPPGSPTSSWDTGLVLPSSAWSSTQPIRALLLLSSQTWPLPTLAPPLPAPTETQPADFAHLADSVGRSAGSIWESPMETPSSFITWSLLAPIWTMDFSILSAVLRLCVTQACLSPHSTWTKKALCSPPPMPSIPCPCGKLIYSCSLHLYFQRILPPASPSPGPYSPPGKPFF